MNLCDVTSRELYERRITRLGRIRLNQDLDAPGYRLAQGRREIRDFIPGQFPAVWKRQVTIRREHRDFAKFGFKANPPIGI
jgi:hypothetical protein